ncbi:hypothetical protein JYU34_004861 [Plutella xylostella]|uniref:DDE Tnp4 domain-containing protein n=1 Tax=Plutella xylostella TaxID=51655 RepID=A0ABQ7QVC0_PLUXY|nr:hypothetical protein JYU34_004861 [Plutella xylostella]
MLQIVKSILNSSSESSSSDDDDIIEMVMGLNESENSEEEISEEDLPPPKKRVKRSALDFENKYFGDIHRVSHFTKVDFLTHFKISRISFEELLGYISTPQVTAGRPPIPLKESLLITIWTLQNQETFKLVAQRFHISIGHCVRVYHETCTKISNFSHKYIVWPTGEASKRNIEQFSKVECTHKLPNLFGCIGATHIKTPPSQTDVTYYDNNRNHSIILQAVCNAQEAFLNVNVGSPGSYPYCTVWEKSGLHKKLCENPKLLPQGAYIIGDSSYCLSDFMMVPFKKGDTSVTRSQAKIFNAAITSTRFVVYKAFGRLKGIFKRLQYLNVLKVDNAKFMVTAACVLHNIALEDGVSHTEVERPYLDACNIDPEELGIETESAKSFRLNLVKEMGL